MKNLSVSIFALSAVLFSCSDDDEVTSGNGTTTVVVEEVVPTESNLVYTKGTKVDISLWDWKDANITAADITTDELSGSLTTDLTLDAAKIYSLKGSYTVESGATLTIPAGTKIIANPDVGTSNSNVFIAVLKGAKINIEGTSTNPVIMSSENGRAGEWGGLTICGEGLTSAGDTALGEATAEVGNFKYGGKIADDNSGSIEYLVIRGAGASINPDSEYNGLSLYAVGSGTSLENVSIIDGADDGVEFFGGSVSITNLYLENNEDDSIDWTEKWDGTVTNSFISNTKSFSTAVEADKDNGNPKLVNITAISNVGGTALQFKAASGATITNLFLEGYTKDFDAKDEALFDPNNVIIDGSVVVTK